MAEKMWGGYSQMAAPWGAVWNYLPKLRLYKKNPPCMAGTVFKIYFYYFNVVDLRIFAWVCARECECRSPWRLEAQDFSEQELQSVMRPPVSLLGTSLRSFARAMHALNGRTLFPAQFLETGFLHVALAVLRLIL